jgi:hypothetical protein
LIKGEYGNAVDHVKEENRVEEESSVKRQVTASSRYSIYGSLPNNG